MRANPKRRSASVVSSVRTEVWIWDGAIRSGILPVAPALCLGRADLAAGKRHGLEDSLKLECRLYILFFRWLLLLGFLLHGSLILRDESTLQASIVIMPRVLRREILLQS